MDLTRAVTYRGFGANTLTIDSNGRIYGCEVKRVDWGGVRGVGYIEKRSLADGLDASDVFLGGRVIRLSGSVYGVTRGQFFDNLQDLIHAFTPTSAFDESPGDKGYLALDYYIPTEDTGLFPDGYIHKMVLVRPLSQPTVTYLADAHGGLDAQPLAADWFVDLEARDPRVYAYAPTETGISYVAQSGSGNIVNNGKYPAPLNILLKVANSSPAGTFTFVGAGTDMTITIETSVPSQIYRYSATEKVLTVEKSNVEVLRMDLLTFNSLTSHPLVPVGTTPYEWTLVTANLSTDCRFWHWDAWAG